MASPTALKPEDECLWINRGGDLVGVGNSICLKMAAPFCTMDVMLRPFAEYDDNTKHVLHPSETLGSICKKTDVSFLRICDEDPDSLTSERPGPPIGMVYLSDALLSSVLNLTLHLDEDYCFPAVTRCLTNASQLVALDMFWCETHAAIQCRPLPGVTSLTLRFREDTSSEDLSGMSYFKSIATEAALAIKFVKVKFPNLTTFRTGGSGTLFEAFVSSKDWLLDGSEGTIASFDNINGHSDAFLDYEYAISFLPILTYCNIGNRLTTLRLYALVNAEFADTLIKSVPHLTTLHLRTHLEDGSCMRLAPLLQGPRKPSIVALITRLLKGMALVRDFRVQETAIVYDQTAEHSVDEIEVLFRVILAGRALERVGLPNSVSRSIFECDALKLYGTGSNVIASNYLSIGYISTCIKTDGPAGPGCKFEEQYLHLFRHPPVWKISLDKPGKSVLDKQWCQLAIAIMACRPDARSAISSSIFALLPTFLSLLGIRQPVTLLNSSITVSKYFIREARLSSRGVKRKLVL